MTSSSISVSQLFSRFVDKNVDLDSSILIADLAWDSRKVNVGDCFFACDGENIHGKKFIANAVALGAVAIALETDDVMTAQKLSEEYKLPVIPVKKLTQQLGFIAAKFFSQPSAKVNLIGITGTNGKTSCTHILAQCLNQRSQPCGVIGTLGAGLWGELKAVINTTPGAIELQQWLHKLVQAQAKTVIMEVSSHGLAQGRVNGCEFDIAVFTNLTQDHLDYHGTMENYGKAKLKLFTDKNLGSAVVNLDDPFSRVIMEAVSNTVSVIGITLNSETMLNSETVVIVGSILSADNEGMLISINSPFGNGEIRTSLIGEFNATNLLIALACAIQSGKNVKEICQVLAKVHAPAGRLEKFGGNDQPMVVIDYAHTPDALEKVLTTLKKQLEGKLLLLMGCGGDRDKSKRAKMGEVAEAQADVVWLTNDNPRTESPIAIVDDILKGMNKPKQIMIELDRAQAIRSVVASASTNDIVLIAGKGHETYQIIGQQRFDFSDREIVTEILGEAA